jgi:hypothetical protein
VKEGDLVRCNFQPRCGGWDPVRERLKTMEHTIKGELGIIVAVNQNHHYVMFPQLGYTHPLAHGVLEIISESR